jgi:anti-sigma-K factor RskA
MSSRSRTSFWRLATLAWGLTAALAPAACRAQSADETAEPPALPEVLAGILYYTRWPQPVERLRLCLGQGAPEAAALLRELEARQAPPP